MNCPNCNQQVPSDAVTCPECEHQLSPVVGGGESAQPDKKSRPGWMVFGGVAAAVLAIGVAAFALGGDQPAGAQYADRMPAGAVFYLEVDVAELTSADARGVVDAFAPVIEQGSGEEFDLDAAFEEMLDSLDAELAIANMSYDEDIASWATGPVAVGVYATEEQQPSFAAVVGGDDAGALDATLEKLRAEADGTQEVAGVEFLTSTDAATGQNVLIGRVDNDLVAVNDPTLAEAIIGGPAQTLAADEGFAAQIGRLPDTGIFLFALDGDAAAALGEEAAALGPEMLIAGGMGNTVPPGWMAGALGVDDGNLRMDYVANTNEAVPAPTSDPAVEAALPAETIAFLRLGGVFDQAETVLGTGMLDGMEEAYGITAEELLGLFSEDGALAVWPSTDAELPVNAAVVGLSDANQSAVVDKLADLSETLGWAPVPTDSGYRFQGLVDLGTRDALTILTTQSSLIDAGPDSSFADGDLRRRAGELVDGDIQFAMDVPSIVDLVDGLVATGDPEAAEMLGCLPLGVVAAGTDAAGDTVHSSVVLEIAPRC